MAETMSGKAMLKWTARACFIVAVTALTWFSVSMAIVAICACILVALQARASTLIEVSFGPLRAKLERELSEAEKLVGKLREFATLQAKALVTSTIRVGRWADATPEWQFDSLRQTEDALRDLGVPEEALSHVRSDFVKFTVSDAGNSALGTNSLPSNLPPEGQSEWQAIRRKGLDKTPDEIESFLTKWEALTSERKTLLDDMRWMLEHRDIRDRAQFLRAHDAVEWPR
jgi:hypothetical protein